MVFENRKIIKDNWEWMACWWRKSYCFSKVFSLVPCSSVLHPFKFPRKDKKQLYLNNIKLFSLQKKSKTNRKTLTCNQKRLTNRLFYYFVCCALLPRCHFWRFGGGRNLWKTTNVLLKTRSKKKKSSNIRGKQLLSVLFEQRIAIADDWWCWS